MRSAAELVEWCRDRIAHYKCPRRVDFTEALPRHDNGKLYKHQLREQLRNQIRTSMGICDGRVVIVTGSGRGIGREHALAYAARGRQGRRQRPRRRHARRRRRR